MVDTGKVKKILFVTLSNLGDIILTTPVLEKLHGEFPSADIDVLTSAAGTGVFSGHPAVKEILVSGGRRGIADRIRRIKEIRSRGYDLIVDLKNPIMPYLGGARLLTRPFGSSPSGHKREQHLSRLEGLVEDPYKDARFFLPVTDADRSTVDGIIDPEEWKRVVVLNPGAKSHLKRWPAVKFAALSDMIVADLMCRVIVTGNSDDVGTVREFLSFVKEPVVNMCEKTTLGVLAEIIRRADLLVTNDSAPMHIASVMDTPTVAIFGPSDERCYGPLARASAVVTPDAGCRPCGRALCSVGPDEGCIASIGVDEVFTAVRKVLGR